MFQVAWSYVAAWAVIWGVMLVCLWALRWVKRGFAPKDQP
ncbi:hypothetical protein U91I_02798 [alpha proteobacterium U9-1i]|nr:hypothetical protein U91I_02798 [alpha proteobacterium U9-1i]